MLSSPSTKPVHGRASSSPLNAATSTPSVSSRHHIARNHTWSPAHGIQFSIQNYGVPSPCLQASDQANSPRPRSTALISAKRPSTSKTRNGLTLGRVAFTSASRSDTAQPAQVPCDVKTPMTYVQGRKDRASIEAETDWSSPWAGRNGYGDEEEISPEQTSMHAEGLLHILGEWDPLSTSTRKPTHGDVIDLAEDEDRAPTLADDSPKDAGQSRLPESLDLWPLPTTSPAMVGNLDLKQSNQEDEEIKSQEEPDYDSETEEELEVYVPLSFKIPEDVLRAAMQASTTNESRYYRHDFYRGPDNQPVSVHYCKTFDVAERAAKYFLNEKVLGFDIEWRPWANAKTGGIKENVSLIQVASENRIALFHLALFKGNTPEELIPPSLKVIIEDPEIYKVGVSIKGDFNRVDAWLGTKARGKFELSRLHNLVEHYATDPSKVTKKLVSLAVQVEQHLQLPLFKGKVRESDWSATTALNHEQITYAATDAYAGLRIYDVLESKRVQLNPRPPRPDCADLDIVQPIVVNRPNAASKPTMKPEADDVEGDEEFVGSEESDTSYDAESPPESSEETYGPEDDFAPPTTLIGRISLNTNQVDGTRDSYAPNTRRVDRLRLPTTKSDVVYPTLPDFSSEEENGVHPSAAVETPKQVKGQVAQAAVPGSPALKEEVETKSLESSMNVDKDQGVQCSEEVLTETDDGLLTADSLACSSVPKRKRRARAIRRQSEQATSPVATLAPMKPLLTFTPLEPVVPPKSEEYAMADAWASNYLSSTIPSPSKSAASPPSRIRATMQHLRAYHLWRYQHLPSEEIAKHLRDPPLALSTVNSYMLQAIMLENLDYKSDELRVLLKGLPEMLRRGRFRYLVERVEGEESL